MIPMAHQVRLKVMVSDFSSLESVGLISPFKTSSFIYYVDYHFFGILKKRKEKSVCQIILGGKQGSHCYDFRVLGMVDRRANSRPIAFVAVTLTSAL